MDRKKRRQYNFSPEDKMKLVNLIRQKKSTILNKKTDGATNKQKECAWLDVHRQYNATSLIPRPIESLKKMWEKLKMEAKTHISRVRANSYKTGGGPSEEPKHDPILLAVLELLGRGGSGIPHVDDCDNFVIEVPLSNPNIREARTSTPLEMTGEETEYMTSAPVLIEIQNEESEYMASAPVQNEVINFMASAPVVEVQNEDETNHYTPNSWTNRRRPKILSTHERSEVIEKSQTLEAFKKNYIEREDARASELHSISMKIKEEELAKAIQERKTEEVKTKIQEEILKKIQDHASIQEVLKILHYP